MKLAMLAIMVAAASPASDLGVDAKLGVNVIASRRADVDLVFDNKSVHDYCFYESLDQPELRAKDGSKIPIETAGGGEVPIWSIPNEMQVVWRNSSKQVFRYDIGGSQAAFNSNPLDSLSEMSLDVILFDCIDFHRSAHVYPFNREVRHITLHVTGRATFDPNFKPAPSQP